MTSEKKRSPLLVEEDWWTVWFGLTILLIATVLGILTLSDIITAKNVPKMGKWNTNPADVFYHAKKTPIDLNEGTTLAKLADRINAAKAGAIAEIVPAEGGVRLHIATSRTGDGETIAFKTQLAGGTTALEFAKERPDPAGMGAEAYVSQLLPSANVDIGKGKVTVTAERSASIVLPLLVTMIGIMFLTAIGIWSMGQNTIEYALAFLAIFVLSIISFTIANQYTIT